MKRPLCTICTLFLIIQAARTAFSQPAEDSLNVSDVLADSSKEIVLTGTVSRMEQKQKVDAVFLSENYISISDQKIREPKVLVYIPADSCKIQIKPGNRLRITGEAEGFDPARNPGNFDQKFYYEKQGISFLVWAEKVEIISTKTDYLKQFLQTLRTQWKECLVGILGEYYGNTMSAVLLGEKSGLDEEMKKMYQKSGIGHILAISGLHMSFMGLGLYRLLRKAGLPFAAAGICGGIVLTLYTIMIGQSVSAMRALLMFLIRAGADITGRDYDLPTSLSVSAAVTCAAQPLYLLDPSYQLSYGAILGIALLTPVFEDMIHSRRHFLSGEGKKKKEKPGGLSGSIIKTGETILAGVSSSLAVSVFLMGPLLYFYFEVPPYSVLLNLIIIPAMPLIMGAGLLGSFLTLISDTLGAVVLNVCRIVLMVYDGACSLIGSFPGNRLVTGKPGVFWIGIYYSFILVLCLLYRRIKGRQRQKERSGFADAAKYAGYLRIPGALLLGFSFLMPVICRAGFHNPQGVQIAVLDVGQGDGIFIRSPSGKAYFIDGGSSDISSPGKYRIEPFLLSSGVDCLEYVFLTHGDADHTNGIEELLENQKMGVRVKTLVLPPERYLDSSLVRMARTAEKNGTRVTTMRAENILAENRTGEEFRLTCLAPDPSYAITLEGNAASMVLELTYGNFSMLFTGDLEGAGEKALAESGKLKTCTILKVAHHGSNSSGSEEFLDLVQPACSIISAGRDNRYGHPHPETLENLKKTGSTIYSTQDCGAVSIWTDGRKVKINGFIGP